MSLEKWDLLLQESHLVFSKQPFYPYLQSYWNIKYNCCPEEDVWLFLIYVFPYCLMMIKQKCQTEILLSSLIIIKKSFQN